MLELRSRSSPASGAQSADDLTALNHQVETLYRAGKYAEAVPVATRALAVAEQQLGPDHAQVSVNLDNLAELYRVQGLYADAEPLYKRALAIRDKTVGARTSPCGHQPHPARGRCTTLKLAMERRNRSISAPSPFARRRWVPATRSSPTVSTISP